jgi:hypothetical protein
MKRKLTMPALVKKLDRVFSRFIRMRHADKCGTVTCVTCGVNKHFSEVHAGHFVKRQHMAIRFDTRNVHVQCVKCNLYMGGAQDEYAAYIIKEYGADTLDELLRLKRTSMKWLRSDLEEMITVYESKVKKLEKSLAV